MIGINQIVCGDAIEIAKTLPDESIHTIVTSPPYYGLRDYGHAGQFGLETSPYDYITRLVELFRELRRGLRKDGTLWLNLGDSYSGAGRNYSDYNCGPNGIDKRDKARPSRFDRWRSDTPDSIQVSHSVPKASYSELPPKNLMMIPARVAIALQDDGWILRSEIVWHKVAGMPESVTDRPTRAHEMIYLFSKQRQYFYDWKAVTTRAVRMDKNPSVVLGKEKQQFESGTMRNDWGNTIEYQEEVRLRDVWAIATGAGYKGAHFATFPLELPRRCILLGCPRGGIVYDPFMGAGTTALAAIQNGRSFLGSELNPDYVDMAYKRLANQAVTLFDCG